MVTESGKRSRLIWFSVLLAIFIDQLIKIAVKTSMALGDGFSVFGDWFQIRFIENNGMAFGMELFDKVYLTGFRLVAVAFLVYLIVKLIKNREYPLGFVFSILSLFPTINRLIPYILKKDSFKLPFNCSIKLKF